MVIEKQKEKFSKALGGVYTVRGNRAALSVLYGTENDKSMSVELKGQQITFNSLSYLKLNSEGD
jgi:hypothetical protein